MPGGAERILRRRIGSVKNTKKITRAMELIAATRVARAQQRARAARPYSEQLTGVIENLAAGGADVDHPLLRQAEKVERVAFVVCAGDRGLAGAYNSAVIKSAEREIQALRAEGGDYRIISVGKKVRDYFTFRGFEIDADFEGFTDNPTYENARMIARVRPRSLRLRRSRPGRADLHRVRQHRHPATGRSPFPAARVDRDHRRGRRWRRRRRARRVRLRTVGRGCARRPAASLCRGSSVCRPARCCGVRARQPAAGHEGRHRQRRRAHRQAEPHHEPGSPRVHHDRDHGNRRRCRVTCRRQRSPIDDLRSRPVSSWPRPTRSTADDCHRTSAQDGRIVGIAGPVVDIEFPPDALPEINNAVRFDVTIEGETTSVMAEVAQQLGHSRVRAIALKPTDGLNRGQAVAQPRPRHPGAGRRRHARSHLERHRRAARRADRDVDITERWEIHRPAPAFDTLEPTEAGPRDRHQGHRPSHSVSPGRQDRPVRRCRRRQDRAHHRDDHPCGHRTTVVCRCSPVSASAPVKEPISSSRWAKP